MTYLDMLLFAVLPYAAFLVFFVMTIHRYRAETFTYSSLSSQFLENREHFWGVVPLHYGIITVIAGHLIAFLFPGEILLWNSKPLRLAILEVTALISGLLALLGLLGSLGRRLKGPKLRRVTSINDSVLYALLVFQVASGIYIALFHRWGSSWFAATAAPYLWSLLQFRPDISFLGGLPTIVKLHIVNAYLLIGFFPFTRLVHILVVPNPYLWRKPQVVRWSYGARSRT
ncbi:MAG: respiratory nitrate reductase subunit gamma [Acidobacteria bacterium]|nr:respiratory nitrate reductase subunit gamma [Acidobacteriota bacterium]